MPITPELLVFISNNMAGEGKEEEQQGHRACCVAGPTSLGHLHLISFLRGGWRFVKYIDSKCKPREP